MPDDMRANVFGRNRFHFARCPYSVAFNKPINPGAGEGLVIAVEKDPIRRRPPRNQRLQHLHRSWPKRTGANLSSLAEDLDSVGAPVEVLDRQLCCLADASSRVIEEDQQSVVTLALWT